MPFPVSPNPGDSYTDAYGTVWIYAGSVNGWYRQTVIPSNETSYTAGLITTDKIIDNTIINADVASNAAIAGTKISPNFGSQNVVTTGTSTAASFIPTSSTVPTNGVYLPAANSVALSTNGQGRLFIDASGNIGVGSTTGAGIGNARFGVVGGTVYDGAFSIVSQFTDVAGTNTAQKGVFLGFNNTNNSAIISAAYGNGSEALAFWTHNNTSWGERMRISPAGLVGIGTSSGSARCTIDRGTQADASATGSTTFTNAALALAAGTDTNNRLLFGIGSTGSSPWIQAQNTSSNATASLVLNPVGGSVGIGTASVGAKFHIDDASTGALIRISSSTNGSARGIEWYNNGSANVYGSITSDYTSGTFTYDAGRSVYAGIHAFRIGTGGEAARIDSSGRLLVGTSSSRNIVGNNSRLQVEGNTFDSGVVSITCNENSSAGGGVLLGKSRGGVIGSNTIVAQDDRLGTILFAGADGTNQIQGATIIAAVDGTPGANDMPGRLVFSTTADGAASPTERLRITSAGVLQVADAGNIAVGTTTGTKIGTATTQKLGFFNKTPVVQPAAVADATDAASVITQLNALLARMRDLGLIAT